MVLKNLQICHYMKFVSIETIKSSFPYNIKDFLADDDAVSEKQKELADLIAEYGEQIKELEERLNSMCSK